jgi:HEAT repeat protein
MRSDFIILEILVAALIVITSFFLQSCNYSESDSASKLIKIASQGNSVKERQEACSMLGRFGESKVVDALITYLDDEVLKHCAAKSLGEIGDPKAIKPLLKHVYINKEINREALKALGEIGDPIVLNHLLEIGSNFIPKNESEQLDKKILEETVQRLRQTKAG